MNSELTQTEAQQDALVDARLDQAEAIFDFDRPKGPWRIVNPSGLFYEGIQSRLGHVVDIWTTNSQTAAPFDSHDEAARIINIYGDSDTRLARAWKGCRPVQIEAGDHVVCTTCGTAHEADYCPTAEGHGAAL